MKTISSSRRIIKQTGTAQACVIEPYIPPVEIRISPNEPEEKKPVFSHYTGDAITEEEALFSEETAAGLLDTEEAAAKEADDCLARSAEEAEKLLEAAKAEAQQLLADVEQQAQKEYEAARSAGYSDGHEAGYQEGRRKGMEEGRLELREQLLHFEADMKIAFQSVERAKERCVHAYLEELKDCAVAVAEKVIRISLRSSGEVIKQMIVSATEKLKKTAWVKIYINKGDYDLMMEAGADVIEELSHLSDNIKFVAMDKEDSGNCIIEMPEEIVDISVNTQIENIKDILENVRV